MKELAPKVVVQKRLEKLEQMQDLLMEKDGQAQLEQELGVKLEERFIEVQHKDNPLPGTVQEKKEKTYLEKKMEREKE